MANKKMTKKDYFNALAAIVVDSAVSGDKETELLAFINREIELLEKKSGKSKETKTQRANIAILATIREVLAEQENPVTISELMADARLSTYIEETKDGEKTVTMTNQKLSSLVKKLVDSLEVVRTEDKKKAYFSLAKAEDESDSEDTAETDSEDAE